MTAAVGTGQRFTHRQLCPVCGGHSGLPPGKRQRCYGFLSVDGAYAHCTREELAGGLDPDAANTYAHRLNGPCRCGQQHGPRDRQEDGYIEEDGRRRLVKSIWAETRVDDGTVSAYLRSRGLSGEVPKTLHHHAWSPYYRDGKQILSAHDYHPAMVAAVQAADGRHVAIHRTYLAPNGVGKADVPEQKKSLGPITGAAVRLAKATDKLALTEVGLTRSDGHS